MGKGKKELLESAPWRGVGENKEDKFKDARVKATRGNPGSTPTMYVPAKKKSSVAADDDDDSVPVMDSELRYTFQRNFEFLQRVFSIDTVVKPLPQPMAYNASRSLSFFMSIFTQFFDPQGISSAQKSLGLGQEGRTRNVR